MVSHPSELVNAMVDSRLLVRISTTHVFSSNQEKKRAEVLGAILLPLVPLICIAGKRACCHLRLLCLTDVYNKINMTCILRAVQASHNDTERSSSRSIIY